MNEELRSALYVIKTECSEHKYCKTCPLYTGDKRECMLVSNEELPCEWDVDR